MMQTILIRVEKNYYLIILFKSFFIYLLQGDSKESTLNSTTVDWGALEKRFS